MRVPIPNDMLAPGDSAELWYEVLGGNETLLQLAIDKANRVLDNDSRLAYTGWRFEGYEDDKGQVHEYVVFTVRYRPDPMQPGPAVRESSLLAVASITALVGASISPILGIRKLALAETRVLRSQKDRYIDQPDIEPAVMEPAAKDLRPATDPVPAKGLEASPVTAPAGDLAAVAVGVVLLAVLALSGKRGRRE